MENYNQFSYQPDVVYANNVAKAMRGVFMRMFLALLVTAATSFAVLLNGTFLAFMLQNSWAYWGLLIAEIVLVFSVSGAINKLSATTANLLFFLYAIINGVVLSTIFLVYTISSIAQTFLITAGVFGAMAIYGYTTKSDLSKFGSILMMALIGLLVCIVVNIFLASSRLDWIISIVGVGIFIGLTAWDTQKIKHMVAYADTPEALSKVSTLGALSLYLDFINLFLYLLRFFGGRD
ncbi:MAG: Bax inhibitor-1/YccA family protein [Bacteroidales bacterium]|nr:Bax inhibitor-1/YccA family protein [Bacteroidales bacterium]MDD6141013.1 Bax inhibitor-1/YccA family protein [Bacteroidales bacterium]MDD6622342.1 Bax inhibitor-1/YccA family protein [Bacteroidales bacterium]MDD6668484.1 Bax inhibitor-1/YccA family protein [Bacteroidales bacterium]